MISIGDVLSIAPVAQRWWESKRRNLFLSAWQSVALPTLYDSLCRYYQSAGIPLFTYPTAENKTKQSPLYVADQWKGLTNKSLNLRLRDRLPPFLPTKDQLKFWKRFREFKREETGADWPLHDNKVFRLVGMDEKDSGLNLRFELGKFPDSVMCQYVLESEARIALLDQPNGTPHLPIRDAVARTPDMFVSFCMKNVCRIVNGVRHK